jgi:hypothetical protein
MENDKKLCPIKFLVKSDPYGGLCNKNRCAWYCNRTGDCAVTDIANHIRWVANIGLKVEDKNIV